VAAWSPVYVYGATVSSIILALLMGSSLVLLASFAPPVKIGCLVITICPTMVHGSIEVQCDLLIICNAASEGSFGFLYTNVC
jgi:hypothetical protein